MAVSQLKTVKQTDLILLDRDNVFARTLDFHMEMNYINDNDLSEFLELSIAKITDMRMGVVFGVVTKGIAYKLDKIFQLPEGYFLKLLKRTICVGEETPE